MEWVKLLLSFKKLRLFVITIKVFGVIHEVEDYVRILEERIVKVVR